MAHRSITKSLCAALAVIPLAAACGAETPAPTVPQPEPMPTVDAASARAESCDPRAYVAELKLGVVGVSTIADLDDDGQPERLVQLASDGGTTFGAVLAPRPVPECFVLVYVGPAISIEARPQKTGRWHDVDVSFEATLYGSTQGFVTVRAHIARGRYSWDANGRCQPLHGPALDETSCRALVAERRGDATLEAARTGGATAATTATATTATTPPPAAPSSPTATGTCSTANIYTDVLFDAQCRSADRCRSECDGGNMAACVVLGNSYLLGFTPDGRRLARDASRAVSLLTSACNAKQAQGCIALGDVFYIGKHVPRDATRARQSYETACRLGRLDACCTMQCPRDDVPCPTR